MKQNIFFIGALLFTVSCTQESVPTVTAAVETEPCLALEGEDAADDPAIWLDPANPDQSLIFGSNKKLGLEVYNLEGVRLAHYPTGKLNNVDVALNVQFGDAQHDIVAASNRDFDRIDVWVIDPATHALTLVSDTAMRTQLTGVYGFCLWNDTLNKTTFAFVNNKGGEV